MSKTKRRVGEMMKDFREDNWDKIRKKNKNKNKSDRRSFNQNLKTLVG
jgi:hypothetical protein